MHLNPSLFALGPWRTEETAASGGGAVLPQFFPCCPELFKTKSAIPFMAVAAGKAPKEGKSGANHSSHNFK